MVDYDSYVIYNWALRSNISVLAGKMDSNCIFCILQYIGRQHWRIGRQIYSWEKFRRKNVQSYMHWKYPWYHRPWYHRETKSIQTTHYFTVSWIKQMVHTSMEISIKSANGKHSTNSTQKFTTQIHDILWHKNISIHLLSP